MANYDTFGNQGYPFTDSIFYFQRIIVFKMTKCSISAKRLATTGSARSLRFIAKQIFSTSSA